MEKSAAALAIVKVHQPASAGKVRTRRRSKRTQSRAAFRIGAAAHNARSRKWSPIAIALVLVSIYQAYKPRNDKITDTDSDNELPAFGGGLPPPGISAKAEPVVAARRAAESASERKVCDMIKAPGADALQKA
jgi:hypothetical protein